MNRVEHAGGVNLAWQKHVRDVGEKRKPEWSDDLYRRRREALLAVLEALDRFLEQEGTTIEAYGWTLSADAQWHRVGTPPPPIRPHPSPFLVKNDGPITPGLF